VSKRPPKGPPYRAPAWEQRQAVRITVVEAEAARMRDKARMFRDAPRDHEDVETAATFDRLAAELDDAVRWMRRQVERRGRSGDRRRATAR
jgi:hypothetical protein